MADADHLACEVDGVLPELRPVEDPWDAKITMVPYRCLVVRHVSIQYPKNRKPKNTKGGPIIWSCLQN